MGFLLALVGMLALSAAASPRGDGLRTWTSDDGRTLRASLVHTGDGQVVLELPSGREAVVPIERFSESDRAHIAEVVRRGGGKEIAPLPEETEIDRDLEVTGGPRVFRTPHFEFETDRAVSKAFISEAARIYEGAWTALHALPHGLELAPPPNEDRFRGRFMGDAKFDAIARERMGSIPGQRVVGLFVGDTRELLVPYSSLGAKQLGSRLTLRKSSDTSTLVHEIVHQLMHRWLPVLPTWFSEGLAEYMAAVPSQNGRFDFGSAERGLEERLELQYGLEDRSIGGVKRPSTYFAALTESYGPRYTNAPDRTEESRGTSGSVEQASTRRRGSREAEFDAWTGTVDEYRDAMLFLYYLMHLDDARAPGETVGRYLRSVHLGTGETGRIHELLETFEEDRLAYNEAVSVFNRELTEFRRRVDDYNARVTRYNEQLLSGVSAEDRVEVGEIPEQPVAPERPELPTTLLELADENGSIDLVAFVQRRALPVLLAGRDLRELDRDMARAYEEMGWTIRYR